MSVRIVNNVMDTTSCMGSGSWSQGGLAGRFSTTSSSRRQCWWWGRIWFISLTDSFYKLCQLSALSASILRLPEQTKTGATEAFSGLQTARADRNWCHSGERRLISGTCSYYWRRRIQYTSRLVFAFFDSIIGGVFLSI